MKYKLTIELVTESYEEEQIILRKFPDSYWNANLSGTRTTFYIKPERESDVKDAINEYKERKKNEQK